MLDKLILDHLYMLDYLASRLVRRSHDKNLIDDFRGYGAIGLINAARNYDEKKGSFKTYAYRKIIGAMLDGYRRLENFTHARRSGLPVEFKKMPDDIDQEWSGLSNSISRRMEKYQYGTVCTEDKKSDSYIDELYEVINVLPERYKIILEMRFTKEFTLMEIGKIFKHSEAWASLQVTAAIKQIKIEISRGNYESLDNYGTKKERSNPERFKHNTGKSKNIKRGYKYEL